MAVTDGYRQAGDTGGNGGNDTSGEGGGVSAPFSVPSGGGTSNPDDDFLQGLAAGQQFAQGALGPGPDDQQVMVGWNQGNLAPVEVSRPGESAGMSRRPSLEPSMSSLDRVAGDVFTMPGNDLRDLQMKLFASGFYRSASFDEVAWGTPDPGTYAAFSDFLGHAAVWRNESGEPEPWWKVLDQLAGNVDPDQLAAGGGAGARQAPGSVTRITDPDALKQVFEQASSTVLGRHLSQREQQAFVSMIHRLERDQQATEQQARADRGGADVEVSRPDPQARAVEFAREQDPDLARAHSMTDTYSSFVRMIGG